MSGARASKVATVEPRRASPATSNTLSMRNLPLKSGRLYYHGGLRAAARAAQNAFQMEETTPRFRRTLRTHGLPAKLLTLSWASIMLDGLSPVARGPRSLTGEAASSLEGLAFDERCVGRGSAFPGPLASLLRDCHRCSPAREEIVAVDHNRREFLRTVGG